MKTLIIAEAGVNHNGDINLAYKLIDAAADAGVDMVKFQTFNAKKLVTSDAIKAKYQIKNSDVIESQYEMLQRLELSVDMHKKLVAYCKKKGVNFFSTGFDEDSVDFLLSLGINLFKIPSCEITNLPYLRHIGSYNREIILSTGMSYLDEVVRAVLELELAGTSRNKITVLHCNTEYPTPMCDVNLNAMHTIRDKLGVRVGYSDHTLGIEVAIAAVAMGATVIEKHFTIDRTLPGPDHKASLEPFELKAMIQGIRNIESALGDGVKRPSASEKHNINATRKSIIAARSISRGEIFDKNNITTKRPGTGLSPMLWDEVLGCTARRDYSKDEFIEL